MKIEGYFANYKNANEAVQALHQAGFRNAHVDLNEEDASSMNVRTNFPGSEGGASLSDLVLGSGNNIIKDQSKAPLSAASPMVSGMAGFDEIAEVNYKVIVNVENGEREKAENIIEEKEGHFLNPNVKEPEITGDPDKVFHMAMDQLRGNL